MKRETIPTSGNLDITITGQGTPDGVLIIMPNDIGDGGFRNNRGTAIGLYEHTGSGSASGGCNCNSDQTGQSTMRSWGNSSDSLIFNHMFNGSFDFKATVSFITDGVRLTISNHLNETVKATFIFFNSLTNQSFDTAQMNATVNSSVTITPGFKPDLVFGITSKESFTTDNSTVQDFMHQFGIALLSGTLKQFSTNEYQEYGIGTSAWQQNVTDDYVAKQVNSKGWTLEIHDVQSTSFKVKTIAKDSDDCYGAYLSLKLDSFSLWADIISISTGTGNKAFTGVGFEPEHLFLLEDVCPAVDTDYTSGDNVGMLGYGYYDETDGHSTVCAFSKDANASAVSRSNIDDILSRLKKQNDDWMQSTLNSFDSDGFTINFSTNDAADAKQWVALALAVSTAQTLFPTGIASAEAFGSLSVAPGAVTIAPAGIASAEAFGAFSVAPGAVSIAPTGISSAEAFGSFTLTAGAVSVFPNGIVSAEAFGNFTVSPAQFISPTGIASAEAFGAFTISTGVVFLFPSAIASAEAFGAFVIAPGAVSVAPTGIGTGEAFGAFTVVTGTAFVFPDGIVSAEAFGSLVITTGAVSVFPNGIVSAEAFGNFTVSPAQFISPASIPSEEAFGAFVITTGVVTVAPTGITSAEAFGAFNIVPGAVIIAPTGIISAEAFGAFSVVVGAVTISPVGISSAETFGTFTVSPGGVIVAPPGIPTAEAFGVFAVGQRLAPPGIPSAEAFGAFSLSVGPVTVAPTGIVSGEAFGSFTVIIDQFLAPTGIASAEAFGSFVVSPGAVLISPPGIGSGEAFGTFTIVTGAVTISPTGISSAEAFGAFTISTGVVFLSPSAIASAEAFGAFVIAPGAVSITPVSISSAEAFGSFSVVPGQVICIPNGIPSAEAFGAFSIAPGPVFIAPGGIPSAEAFGMFIVGTFIAPLSIPSGETFGAFKVELMLQFIIPDGIGSGETFGSFVVSHPATPGLHNQFETDIEDVFLTGNADFAEPMKVNYAQEGIEDDIWGIFDNEYVAVSVDSEYEIQSREPTVIIQTRKLRRKLVLGDWFVIRGINYAVNTSEPDGTGISVITFKRKF